VGELVGCNSEAQITSNLSSGNVTGVSRVGDPVGVNAINSHPAKVTASYATGDGDIWDFRTEVPYPALKVDLDGYGVATWQEVGNQGRDTYSASAVPATGPAAPTSVPTLDDGTEMDADSDGLIEV